MGHFFPQRMSLLLLVVQYHCDGNLRIIIFFFFEILITMHFTRMKDHYIGPYYVLHLPLGCMPHSYIRVKTITISWNSVVNASCRSKLHSRTRKQVRLSLKISSLQSKWLFFCVQINKKHFANTGLRQLCKRQRQYT